MIACLSIRTLVVELQKRTFDLAVDCHLQSICIQDSQQSAIQGRPAYLILSQDLSHDLHDYHYDDIHDDQSTENRNDVKELISVKMMMVNEDSPDYERTGSNIRVDVLLGSLSCM